MDNSYLPYPVWLVIVISVLLEPIGILFIFNPCCNKFGVDPPFSRSDGPDPLIIVVISDSNDESGIILTKFRKNTLNYNVTQLNIHHFTSRRCP